MKNILTAAFCTLFATSSGLMADEPSLTGYWVGSPEGSPDETVQLTFEADGTGTIQSGGSGVAITYIEDRAVTPHHLDLLMGGDPAFTRKSIFQFIDADTVKLSKPSDSRATEFGDETLTARRQAAPSGDLAERVVGKWVGHEVDDPDDIVQLTFNSDGTGLVAENGPGAPFTWTVSGETAPYQMTMNMAGEPQMTIFEFVGDNAIRINEPEDSLPVEFDDEAIVFQKVVGDNVDAANAVHGTWSTGENGPDVDLIFNADGTGELIDNGDKMTMTYTLTVLDGPDHLDITIGGETKYSLIDFVSEDQIQVTEPDSNRPAQMEDNVALFFRQPAQ